MNLLPKCSKKKKEKNNQIAKNPTQKKPAAKNIQEMHDTGLPVLMKLDHTSVTSWKAKYILQPTKKLTPNF